MKKFISLLIITFLTLQIAYAQGTAGESAKYEYRQLIDMPTAGVIQKGSVWIEQLNYYLMELL
ncbi:MAG: hypothetical protein MZV64_67010 [Ignavibacteriales bacterium]|nr:hypothetical protein [Ignavibacteriales bacterium]